MDRGQLKLVYRHTTNLGRPSEIMALGAECAGEQGAFWEFHDARYQNPAGDFEGQVSLARSLGLDPDQFSSCMNSQKYWSSITEDRAAAREYGLSYQPNFVISGGGEHTKLFGFRSAEQLSAVIDKYLGDDG